MSYSPISGVRPAAVIAAVTALAAASAAAPAFAAPKTCRSYVLDRDEVVIDGRLGDAESFAGVLHLTTAEQGREPDVQTTGDLTQSPDQGLTIPESRVTVTNPSTLRPFVRGTVRITVGGVRFAGKYHGELAVADEAGCSVGLTVVARGSPKITLVNDKVSLNLARCARHACWPGGFVERLLVPAKQRRNGVAPEVTNDGQGAASVTRIEVRLVGDDSEGSVSKTAIESTAQQVVLEAGHTKPLPQITITRDQLVPDHYQGNINLTIAGEEAIVHLPVSMNVKDGPFKAILLVAVALLGQLGTLVYIRNRPRGPALAERHALRGKLAVLGDDRKLFKDRLDAVRDLIVDGDIKGAGDAMTEIRNDIPLVREAQRLEHTAKERVGSGPLPDAIVGSLATFRTKIAEGEHGAANSALTDLRVAVGNLPAVSASERAPAAGFEVTLSDVRDTADATGAVVSWLGRAIHRTVRALRYCWLRLTITALPVVLTALIAIGVVVVALTTYLSNPTFGKDTWDYLALFAAVLGASVSQIGVEKLIAR